jgi:capsular polysaccharide biosynthesis protein
LLSKGFQIIKSQDLSFLEQVNLFYNLKCIVTLHGAGLSNLVFCRANTKVIEIRTLDNSDIFPKVLSKLCNLQYYSISLKTIYKSNTEQNGLMFCSPAKIDQALKNLNVI